MENLIKVFIADDENLVIENLREKLSIADGFQIVGSANSGERAIEMLKGKPVDIVLMDIAFDGHGDIDGLEAGEILTEMFLEYPKDQKTPHLVFMTKHNGYTIESAVSQLKASIIGKRISKERLVLYLKMIYEDGASVKVPDPNTNPPPDRTQGLKIAIPRLLGNDEDLILIACMVRQGLSSAQIQKELKYKDHTVENKKTIIFNKLKPLVASGIMNNAVLSTLMERSGLCEWLVLNDIEKVLRENT